ncbi:hypothetical protein DFH09DRAFT_1186204, partial [Mycena vulgaris]
MLLRFAALSLVVVPGLSLSFSYQCFPNIPGQESCLDFVTDFCDRSLGTNINPGASVSKCYATSPGFHCTLTAANIASAVALIPNPDRCVILLHGIRTECGVA